MKTKTLSLTPRFSGVCAAAHDMCKPLQRFYSVAVITLLLLPVSISAATNDPSALLQKALFEEEANHNLPAAIQAYQSLVNNLDENRKLAGTAVFRLGECYRKQGRTNEAAAQYERVTRDFSDQSTLVNLSRQNLAGLGQTPVRSSSQPLSTAAAAAEAQRTELDTQIAQLRSLPAERLPAALQQSFPNPLLDSLLQKLASEEQTLAGHRLQFGSANPQVKASQRQIETLHKQIEQQAGDILSGLEVKRDTAAETAKALQSQIAANPSAPRLSDAARQEQKRLLEEEIKLVEKKVADEQKKVQFGQANDLLAAQRELLGLKRQVVALDLGTDAPKEQAETTRAASSFSEVSEAKEIRRIQAMIKDSPDLINANQENGKTLLYDAAEKGHLNVADFLLANGATVSKGGRNETPLHAAARHGHKEVMELLLAHGADVNAGNPGKPTPLHIAAENGLRTVGEALLAHHADPNAKANNDYTPLHFAAQKGFKSMVELLLSHGADVNARDNEQRTALEWAVERGQFDLAKLLVANKADVNLPRSEGYTPLHLAAREGATALVELLLSKDAKSNAQNSAGETPLHLAAARGQTGVVELLLAHQTDINAKDREGLTPLASAMVEKQWNAAKLLIAKKADLNFACNPKIGSSHYAGLYPVHIAARLSDEFLELLLKNGADPDAKNPDGNTPLHLAIYHDDKNQVELLLKYKANPNLGHGNESPLVMAIGRNNKDIVELLLAHDADPNQKLDNGVVPLLLAVSRGQKEIVQALLDHKADVNVRFFNTGDTPLHIAVNAGRKDLIELLLAKGADPNLTNNEGKTPLALTKPAVTVLVSSGGVNAFGPPGPPGTTTVPTRTLRVPGAANPGAEETAAPNEIRDLLVKHGAVEDLPHLDRIEVRRPSANYSATIFRKGANDWNRFTLFELFAVQYQFLTTLPSGAQRSTSSPYSQFARGNGLDYPDFDRVRIRHPAPDGNSWKERTVDLSRALSSGDCSADVALEWGDVVEIPEADHPLNVGWEGLPDANLATLKKCLTREVEVVVKGQSKKITLSPDISVEPGKPTSVTVNASCLVGQVLSNSKLLLASSDLSHLKLKRFDPKTKKPREWVVDCSNARNAPDLWLKDGDVIEVPDRP